MMIIHDERCKIVFSMLWDTKEHLPYCLCLLAWLNILASKHCSVMFDCHVSRLHSLELKCKVQIFPRSDGAMFDIINPKLKPREDNYQLNQNQPLKIQSLIPLLINNSRIYQHFRNPFLLLSYQLGKCWRR